jgi:hypothetical protein
MRSVAAGDGVEIRVARQQKCRVHGAQPQVTRARVGTTNKIHSGKSHSEEEVAAAWKASTFCAIPC